MVLSHRDRVHLALQHMETDRVPMDFGGGPATQIHPEAYASLLLALSIEPEPLTEGPRGEGQTVIPSEVVLRRFDIDTRGVQLPEQHRPVAERRYLDDWGVAWEKADFSAPYINVEGPLQRLESPSLADLDGMDWPFDDPEAPVVGMRERIERIRAEGDFGVVLNLPNASFSQSQRIRGFAEFLER